MKNTIKLLEKFDNENSEQRAVLLKREKELSQLEQHSFESLAELFLIREALSYSDELYFVSEPTQIIHSLLAMKEVEGNEELSNGIFIEQQDSIYIDGGLKSRKQNLINNGLLEILERIPVVQESYSYKCPLMKTDLEPIKLYGFEVFRCFQGNGGSGFSTYMVLKLLEKDWDSGSLGTETERMINIEGEELNRADLLDRIDIHNEHTKIPICHLSIRHMSLESLAKLLEKLEKLNSELPGFNGEFDY